jgi:hypothetical protein
VNRFCEIRSSSECIDSGRPVLRIGADGDEFLSITSRDQT